MNDPTQLKAARPNDPVTPLLPRALGSRGARPSPRCHVHLLSVSSKSWKTVETVADLFLGASKSLQMVIAAMKLKYAYPLDRKDPDAGED